MSDPIRAGESTMSTAALTDVDTNMRAAVMRQLDWDPAVDASAVAVAAKDGTVTLTGYIDTYAGKLAAERAVKRVHGVRAVANELQVRLKLERTDADIARDAARALTLRTAIPGSVQAAVHHGCVTLTGNVTSIGLREYAEKAVRDIGGVRQILNHITVMPRRAAADVQRQIVRALHANADLEARHISVAMSSGVVTLTGTVSTWLQRRAAERAAMEAPGVTQVINQLQVEPTPARMLEPIDEIC
jgi:osmotically-inducible protein OsmY